MELSICSFSFHRLLAAGKQDIFKFITDCRDLGCTQLDPWNAHLAGVLDAEKVKSAGSDPRNAVLLPMDDALIGRIKDAADEAGLPFGCIAVDGAHIYEPTQEARDANRRLAYHWLEVAGKLQASQVRVDAGGPEEMPDDVFEIIVDGYNDLIARARDKGIEVLIENHWGPSPIPDNVVKLLMNIDGLGLLFDTNNWAKGRQREGWEKCAEFARATHIKTFVWDEDGCEPSVDIPKAIMMLVDTGYTGCWGIESCPREVDEYEGVKNTIALIQRTLAALNVS